MEGAVGQAPTLHTSSVIHADASSDKSVPPGIRPILRFRTQISHTNKFSSVLLMGF